MKRKMKKLTASVLAALLLLSLTFTVYGDDDGTAVGETQEELDFDMSAITGEGAVTEFIGKKFYDGKIKTEDDAYDAVYSVIEEVGGDDSTEISLEVTQPTEDGITYYTFSQVADMIKVNGSAIKLIVDKDQNAIGLVSTIVPDLKVSGDQEWEISDTEAEEIVKKAIKDQSDMSVIPDVTEEAVVPAQPGSTLYVYCWIVYTNNTDTTEAAPYLAHYVAADGEYLYAIPVSTPNNKDALAASVASFAFDESQYEADEWEGTVKLHDGTKEELTLPVMVDKKTGEMILGDLERKALCVDYADFMYKDTLTPRASKDGKFADNELLIYCAFLDVYDLYGETGWEGPDGEGTPSLLLMDMVDEDGEPIQNAYYSGINQGFRTFCFNRLDPDGECYDIIAHEFSHCVTESCMTGMVYQNDCGAINEGMSDALGNIIEAMLEMTEDETWLIQENGNEVLRSMSDPNEYEQPAFVWDRYYVPPAAVPAGYNDNGGVHKNSSLLNVIAYALNDAGMPLEDQMYYWMNIAFALTPKTDFSQLSEIMPWSLKLFGFDKYVDTMNKAIEKTGIADRHFPEDLSDDLGMIFMEYPENLDLTEYPCVIDFCQITDDGLVPTTTWPDAYGNFVLATLEEGNYFVVISYMDAEGNIIAGAIATSEGWEFLDADGLNDFFENVEKYSKMPELIATVEGGEIIEIETKTLAENALAE